MTERVQHPDPLGNDPYDALRSPLIPAAVRARPIARQVLIQTRKLLPIDVARIMRIKPFLMAKTLGCLLWAHARACLDREEGCEETAINLVEMLDRCEGSSQGGGWGYEFDVQTRWTYYPAGTPNIVVTAFVGRGLLCAGAAFGNGQWIDRGIECAKFIRENLLLKDPAGRLAFRYHPRAEDLVHNANLLGCALIANASALAGEPRWLDEALEAATVTIAAQTPDGAWPYGDGPSLDWVDSFHTAYNLDGLLQLMLASGDMAVSSALRKGVEYWESMFFGDDGEPHYYANRRLPYDIHTAGTAIDVGSRLSTWGLLDPSLPRAVERWTAANLVDPDSQSTWYRRYRWFTDRRNFARWGDAHFALGRASLMMLDSGRRDLVENMERERSDV